MEIRLKSRETIFLDIYAGYSTVEFHEINEFIIIYFIETTIKMSLSDHKDS